MLVMDPLTKETYSIIILAERSLPGKRVYTGTFTDPLVKVIIKTLQENINNNLTTFKHINIIKGKKNVIINKINTKMFTQTIK